MLDFNFDWNYLPNDGGGFWSALMGHCSDRQNIFHHLTSRNGDPPLLYYL
ncbi:hypothetical protein IQE94_12490 [Synechocystis sp. PCC 7339]|nr:MULTISPECIES: hypothetical protein [unclassified Synechocystis]QUS59732.1 hypothetical protein HTZ78_02915 [Synechocystis sp. PCC 7338]UAJ71933.1 hypothetical protein IQE94_12490 [Synechocystis sp. PCC 7339]